MYIRLYISFWLVLCSIKLWGNSEYRISPQVVETYKLGIALKLEDMTKALSLLKVNEPDNSFIHLLSNYQTLIKLLVDEDYTEYRVSLSKRDRLIADMKLSSRVSPWYNWALSEVYLQWSLIRLRYQDNIKAANDLRKSRKYLDKCQDIYPGFYISQKTLAIIEALAGAVPEQYEWLANIAGIKGNKRSAVNRLKKLKITVNSSTLFDFIDPEISFYILFIEQNLNADEGIPQNKDINRYRSGLLGFADIWILSKANNSGEVIKRIDKLEQEVNGLSFCYLDFLKAEAKLNQLQNPINDFQEFLNCTKGKAFIKSARRKMAWYSLIQDDTSGYFLHIRNVIKNGSTFLDDDKQAEEEAKILSLPNKNLLSARLLFDGGNFVGCLKLLESISGSTLNNIEELEKVYREARAYQKLDSLYLAQRKFRKTISKGRTINKYFASSAAYQLALIKKNIGQNDSARYYLNLIPQFPSHAYSESFSLKKASLLSELSN